MLLTHTQHGAATIAYWSNTNDTLSRCENIKWFCKGPDVFYPPAISTDSTPTKFSGHPVYLLFQMSSLSITHTHYMKLYSMTISKISSTMRTTKVHLDKKRHWTDPKVGDKIF